jgi:hypothetical protein
VRLTPSELRGRIRAMALIDAETSGEVRRWSGEAAWYFLTVDAELSDEIRGRTERVGFGSVRVTATIGRTTWSTSVFPDAASGCYVLPVKAAVRRAEGIDDGTPVTARLRVEG